MSKFLDMDGLEYYTSRFKPELVDIVDSGAKNVLKINRSSQTIFTSDLMNTVVVNGTTASSGDANVFLNLNYSNQTTITIPQGDWIIVGYGDMTHLRFRYAENDAGKKIGNYGEPLLFTVTSTAINNWVRIECQENNITFDNVTVQVMLCTQAAWNISHTFVPYRNGFASNEEIYNCFQNA